MTDEHNPWMRIVGDIATERERQEARWGPVWDLRNRHPLRWLPILMEEMGEVSKAINDHPAVDDPSMPKSFPELRTELVQVAAVAACWLEAMDLESEL